MGVLNITPDSFSDGGRYSNPEDAADQALRMMSEGASIIDVGGESTRPGANPVSVDQELSRVIPVIEAIRKKSNVVLSIDSSKPQVVAQAIAAGANIINDVYALRQPGAIEMAALLQVPVCLMHMQEKPQTMQLKPDYVDVVDEVKAFFDERIAACVSQGIRRDNIILDPGFGFGKTLQHNLTLLSRLNEFANYRLPILAGLSRKSMLGALLDKDVGDRAAASVTAALLAVIKGALIVRVHDVAETAEALMIYQAVKNAT
ncbi:MAG: dihydropteroate synthase [Cycloclasticus sp.]|nr:dihydropteroate synthase [Cycloclasticus sp.]MBQ0789991.1 dihydropteroate synthase [Cycloclasticus sp.]